MLKLKSLLTEAPADDVAKLADAPLATTVSMLKKLAADKDVVNVLAAGTEDGDIKDEQVNFGSAAVSCRKMFPTQAEIGFGNSIDDACKVQPWRSAVKAAFKAPVLMPSKPDNIPVLAASVGGKIFILDGHHRWSLCFMINPDAKMQCDIMEVPSGKDAEDALKIMQMAIAAKAGRVLTKDFEGKDLMGVGSAEVQQYVLDNIEQGRIDEFAEGNPALDSAEAIAEHMAANHGDIKAMKGKFPRSIMPQADHSGAPQGTVNKSLERGTINFDEPFGEGVTLKEHFQKIAKIKK